MQAALALVQEVKHGTTRGGEAVVESDAAFRDIGLAVERLAGGVTTIESTAEVVTRAVDQAATPSAPSPAGGAERRDRR
jgi:hypothetical protein